MLDKIANRYTIENLIGQGGMADVYVAFDEILNRQVAIKILRQKLSEDPLILVRFTREASAASRLSHPNVVDIYDVGEYEGLHYIVMEYIKGQTLKQIVSRRGALDVWEALSVMKQLTSGVSAAHSSQIIHRDIKPQNILVKADGTIKITDFGIAVANGAVSLTHNNAVMGSAHYLAPESAQGKTPDEKVDVYSLGIVFYELLSGEVPFKGSSPAEIALNHMAQPIPSIRKLNPSIPQSIENIIIKATAKDPAERYNHVYEMSRDLDHCLDPDKRNEKPLVLKVQQLPLPLDKQGSARKKSAAGADVSGKTASPTRRKKEKRRPSVISTLAVICCSILAACLIAGGLLYSGVVKISGIMGYSTFPSLVNMSLEQAEAVLQEAGFENYTITTTQDVSDSVQAGKIIKTDIKSGTVVKADTPIEITISKGPSFLISDYTGQYLSDVQDYLNEENVSIEYSIDYEGVKNTNPGVILSQDGLLPGDRIDPDQHQVIHFVVSQYPTIVLPESLIGMDIQEAQDYLNSLGIAVYAKNVDNLSVVVDVDPEVGSTYTQEGTDNVVTLYH